MNKIGISIKCSHNFLVIIIIINKFSNWNQNRTNTILYIMQQEQFAITRFY